MKTIPLTKGLHTVVDDADYVWLSQWSWHASSSRGRWYAARGVYDKSTGRTVTTLMHRLLCASKNVDHKDGDGLNNRRSNLRAATSRQNAHNRRKRTGCHSQYKGVSWEEDRLSWRAYITVEGRYTRLGRFGSEKEAALAYNKAARKAFGEFARLNEIRQ